MKLSDAQQRTLDAAAAQKLRVSTKWSTWDFWIDGVVPFTKGNVRRTTIAGLVKRGLLVNPASGDRLVLPTDEGRALAFRETEETT